MTSSSLMPKNVIFMADIPPNNYLHQERGTLPPNLHVQPRAKRFDPFGEETEGDSDLDRVTAFPGSNTIIVDPENRNSVGLMLQI